MNPECNICRAKLLPIESLYSTYCGHIFHYTCLLLWLKRSKTCPQCRQETDDKKIFRIWLDNGTSHTSLITDVVLQEKKNSPELIESINREIGICKLQIDSTSNKIKNLEKRVKKVEAELNTDNLRLKKQLDDSNKKLSSANSMGRKYLDKIAKLQAELKSCKVKKAVVLEDVKKYQLNVNQESNKRTTKRLKKSTETQKDVVDADENSTVFSPKLKNLRPSARRALALRDSNRPVPDSYRDDVSKQTKAKSRKN